MGARARTLGRQERVGEVVGHRGARVDGAAQVDGAALAEAWRAQSVVGDGHLQQRVRACVCRFGAAKRGALDDDLEGAGLVAERRHRVLVDGREGVGADVGVGRRRAGRYVCAWLVGGGILCAEKRQRWWWSGLGARSRGAVQTLLPLIARGTQIRVEGCAVRGCLRREDKGLWVWACAVVARADDGSVLRALAVLWTGCGSS